MKLVRTGRSGFVFHFDSREKQLLLDTIELYPLVPASHYRLTRKGDVQAPDEDQRLLEESLAEQRKENREQVQTMLDKPRRFRETKAGLELTLTPGEVEWLLQVLNDVRVGSWLALGEPEQGGEPEITEQNARFHIALMVCGMFQSVLLAALGVSESPKWADD